MSKTSDKVKKFYITTVITAVLAGLLLLVANSAIWANRYIFDRDNFTNVAVASLSSESSRQAISSEITNRALQNNPLLQQTLGSTIEKIISGILGTNQFEAVLTTTISQMQVYLTSENRESIEISLTTEKEIIGVILNALERTGRDESAIADKVNSIPNNIVLLNKDTVPNFYQQSVALLWAGPLAALGAIIALAVPYVVDRRRYIQIALIQGGAIMLFGIVAMLFGPLFRPPVLANIPTANARIVIGNIYDAFIQTFNAQSQLMLIGGATIIVLASGIYVGRIIYLKRYKHTKK